MVIDSVIDKHIKQYIRENGERYYVFHLLRDETKPQYNAGELCDGNMRHLCYTIEDGDRGLNNDMDRDTTLNAKMPYLASTQVLPNGERRGMTQSEKDTVINNMRQQGIITDKNYTARRANGSYHDQFVAINTGIWDIRFSAASTPGHAYDENGRIVRNGSAEVIIPGWSGVRIHSGKDAKSSEGCIICSFAKPQNGYFSNPKKVVNVGGRQLTLNAADYINSLMYNLYKNGFNVRLQVHSGNPAATYQKR